MNNQISKELSQAISTLYNDPSIGLGFLGLGVDFIANGKTAIDGDLPYQVRIKMLKEKLEEFVVQMSLELEELGEEEEERLRSEATSMLVILREINSHFPELE